MSYNPTNTLPANVVFEGIQCIDRHGDFWFPAPELGRLLGYSEPAKQINKLYQRHVQFLQEHTSIVNMRVEVGMREVRIFDEVGAYYLTMKSETEQANEASIRLAKAVAAARRQKLESMAAVVSAAEARVLALEGEKERAKAEGVLAGLSLSERERGALPKLLRYQHIGLSRTEIGRLLDMSKTRLQALIVKLQSLGIVPGSPAAEALVKAGPATLASRPGARRPLVDAERVRMLSLKAQGASLLQIAQQTSRAVSTVKSVLAKARKTAQTLGQGL